MFVCSDLFTQLSVSLFAGFTYSPNAVSTQSPGDPVQICGGVFENMSGHADESALCIQRTCYNKQMNKKETHIFRNEGAAASLPNPSPKPSCLPPSSCSWSRLLPWKTSARSQSRLFLSWDNFEPKASNFCLNEQQELSCFRCGTSVRNIFPCASKSWHQASCRVLVI